MNIDTIRVDRSRRDGEFAESWPGTVRYDDERQSARFTPQTSFNFERPLYTLTVFGDVPNGIRDVEGLALDGNRDGSPGGNFTSTFIVERGVFDL